MSNTYSATTPGCAHLSRHSPVCRTQPVLQHQAVHTSHGTLLYVEQSQCYNTRLCTHHTALCCVSNKASAIATPGCAHISRHCAVCRTQPVLQQHQPVHIISRHCAVCRTQLVLQHKAVHTSHGTVLYVEQSQCYSNIRLCTHLMALCCMSNTAGDTATPGCAHISRHCAICRTQLVLQHQAVHTSHDTVLKSKHIVSATLRTQRLFMFPHPQLTTAINFSADAVSSPTACSLRIRVQNSLRRPITLIDGLLAYHQSLQSNASIVLLNRTRPLTSSFCPIQYSLKHISLYTK
jgi:hypothetical protein